MQSHYALLLLAGPYNGVLEQLHLADLGYSSPLYSGFVVTLIILVDANIATFQYTFPLWFEVLVYKIIVLVRAIEMGLFARSSLSGIAGINNLTMIGMLF